MNLPVASKRLECTPRYPAEAKRNGLEGEVLTKVLVEPTGKVSKVELIQSSGFAVLDRAAMETTKCLVYEPGTIDGVPTSMWTDFPLNYRLEK
ncbi:energy transducer TonB [Variovorax flavidus]|uniref:energy transducer TonB n=1 Tax=Variovorax flavidus TaxID=3053501 RepID=UPI003365A580